MILAFSKIINNNPSEFDSKIWKGLIDNKIFSLDDYRKFLIPDELNLSSTGKLHTIRRDTKNRWKAGNKIHAVLNHRTKEQYQFAPVFECTGVQVITIWMVRGLLMNLSVDYRALIFDEISKLSVNDGFADIQDFEKYFWNAATGDQFQRIFKGKIIHWTKIRY